jgi:hypothetical protein
MATAYEQDKPIKWQMAPFNNTYSSSVFASLDNVAIESVGYDFLRSEFTVARLSGLSGTEKLAFVQMRGADDYLHQAADSTNWPAGIKYDPDSTGIHIYSLGVHEHWNNATDKKYTRNLGTGNGIELKSVEVGATATSVASQESNAPEYFALYQNYPNPFNPTTNISYSIPTNSKVVIKIYNITGREIETIENSVRSAGTYTITFDKVNPFPEWFKDAKFGIYFHWGVFSVPAYANEWYPRTCTSKDLQRISTTQRFMATRLSGRTTTSSREPRISRETLFSSLLSSNRKGENSIRTNGHSSLPMRELRFAGPVAEHHDGFSMWASKVNPWNAKDMGPKLDLVGLLTDAIRKKGMRIILSMHHAYNITGYYQPVPPMSDPKLQMLFGQQGKEKNEAYWLSKHKEIIDGYKPDIIYQDFNLQVISQPILLAIPIVLLQFGCRMEERSGGDV